VSTYLIGSVFFRIVREPQYPGLLTLLAERRELLEHADPAGPGALCRSLDHSFPFALHAHYLSLPAEFGVVIPSRIPVLDQPITPRPHCWRWSGLQQNDENPEEWEEHVGFLSHDQRPYLEPLLTAHYRAFTVMPWFAPAPSEVSLESSGRAHPRQ